MTKKFKSYTIIAMLISLPLLDSCKKDKNQADKPGTVPERLSVADHNVTSFQLVTLGVKGDIKPKYQATFGGVSVDLVKSSDSTLYVFVPEEANGETMLKSELGDLTFSVTKTTAGDPDEFITDFEDHFDNELAAMQAETSDDEVYIAQLTLFKDNILKTWEKMSNTDKKKTLQFYNANRTKLHQALQQLDATLSLYASTGVKIQKSPRIADVKASNNSTNPFKCPSTNLKEFHDCLGGHLSTSFNMLREQLWELGGYTLAAGAMAGTALKVSALGPVAIGITAVGIALPAAMATYLLFADVLPTTKRLVRTLLTYLKTPWIFYIEKYSHEQDEYPSGTLTTVDVETALRTVEASDGKISPNTNSFISALNNIRPVWDKFKELLQELPGFEKKKTSVALAKTELAVSNISNSNVSFEESSGGKLKFKSLSGQEERFNFRLAVLKEGFTETADLSGKVLINKFELKGTWKLNFYKDGNRSELSETDIIDFGTGAADIGWPVSYISYPSGDVYSPDRTDRRFTFNQSFDATSMKLSLTHNYWNVHYLFIYDTNQPNRLIGESIGLSNNGFNMELVK